MPDWLLHDYWPWWFSAAFFATMVVGVWLAERRLLGVSGSYAAAIERTREEDEAARRLDEADAAAIDDALMRATLAAFGPEAVAELEREQAAAAAAAPAGPPIGLTGPRQAMPRSAHVTFLVMLAVGGLLGALGSSGWEVRTDLGPLHEALTGGGAISLLALVGGGFLVGFGTRMAGGCTSGHGLSGCSRLQPASLVATASFFGTAVAVSFALEAVAR